MMSSHVANVVMINTCCERRFNVQEEMLALSGTQRHVRGPLCTNKLQKHGMSVYGLPKPNFQTVCVGYIFPGWCYLHMTKSYIFNIIQYYSSAPCASTLGHAVPCSTIQG